MAFVTHRLKAALEQIEARQQRLDDLAANPAGAAELADAVGLLGTAWTKARCAAVEACQTDQTPYVRERRRFRLTPMRARIR